MILIAEMNNFGHLEVDVVNRRLRKKINKELNRQRPLESVLYLQNDYTIDDFIENYIPKKRRKDLQDGYTVRFRFSLDDFSCMVGLD